jgi:O-antigen biosynthesis protein
VGSPDTELAANTVNMKFSVIIVNFNVKDFLAQALRTIRKSIDYAAQNRPGLESEIFVVDNASDDGSVEMLRSQFPDVITIANKKNVGFAGANNVALAQSRGEFILLINPDTVVQEDTVDVMISAFEKDPALGMAGCKILNPDGTLQLACRRGFPTPWVAFAKISGLSLLLPKTKLFGRYNVTYRDPDESYEVDAISGSFMMIRRAVYEQVGGLDDTFFMYGEDLDWCYRIQKSGWKIFYIAETQIIHYKGESTRRSDIDEIRTFYKAMSVFVEKNISRSPVIKGLLNATIWMRALLAWGHRSVQGIVPAAVDFLIVNLAFLSAEYLWLGDVLHFPDYAYPTIFIVPPLILIGVIAFTGGYKQHRLSVSRAFIAVTVTIILISAITFFFKDYAFSRMVVLITGAILIVLIPGWRLFIRLFGRVPGVGGMFKMSPRRTLIVGINPLTPEIIKKLRKRIQDSYRIIGIIDTTRQRVGEEVQGIPVIGSITNIGKVVREHRISDVIFSPETLSYGEILSVISKSNDRSVNYKLIPTDMEVVIGKGTIDQLDEVPLIEIEYNINRQFNRVTKRIFDIGLGLLLLVSIYPFRTLLVSRKNRTGENWIDRLPKVLAGAMSFVGPSADTIGPNGMFLGKPGLTGLVQLQRGNELDPGDIHNYNVYYAKNQSFFMDVEILLKNCILYLTSDNS